MSFLLLCSLLLSSLRSVYYRWRLLFGVAHAPLLILISHSCCLASHRYSCRAIVVFSKWVFRAVVFIRPRLSLFFFFFVARPRYHPAIVVYSQGVQHLSFLCLSVLSQMRERMQSRKKSSVSEPPGDGAEGWGKRDGRSAPRGGGGGWAE